MTRILFYKPPRRFGELYFRLEQYRRELLRRGVEIGEIPQNPKNEPFYKKALFFCPRFLRELPMLLRYRWILACPTPNMLWRFLLWRLLGRRIIVEHFVSYVAHREVWRTPLLCDRWAYRLAEKVVVHTETLREEMADTLRVPPSRILVNYCVVDLQAFSPRPPDERLWQALGLGKRFVVMYHGMYHPWHGYEVLFEAAKRLEGRGDIVFLIIPKDEYQDTPNTVFVPEQPYEKLPEYLALADMWASGFVKTHARGDRAFSSTLIQALAMGKPVITARSPEKGRFLKEGETVFWVEPENPQALAERIVHCATHRAEVRAMRARARALAEQSFSLRNVERVMDAWSGNHS